MVRSRFRPRSFLCVFVNVACFVIFLQREPLALVQDLDRQHEHPRSTPAHKDVRDQRHEERVGPVLGRHAREGVPQHLVGELVQRGQQDRQHGHRRQGEKHDHEEPAVQRRRVHHALRKQNNNVEDLHGARVAPEDVFTFG